MIEFKMPLLGADMEAGTLVAWQKQPGDAVRRGDILADVETDKGVIAVESFAEGVLDQILVPVGAEVPVGTTLALLRSDQEPATAPPVETRPAAPPRPAVEKVSAGVAPGVKLPEAGARVAASPSARRLARELGVEISTLVGTGPGGAITRDDVERAAQTKPPPLLPAAAPPPEVDRATRMRRTIAAAMSRSKREIPHYYLSHTIDLQPALDWLTAENERRPITDRLMDLVLLIKGTALALQEVPELNALWEQDRAVLKPDVHIGVAIALRQGGLVAPALHHVPQKSLDQLNVELRELVQRAKSGGLKSSELADPTITVTSLGDRGVEAVFGVIYPPQTAIVGFGKIVERPWSIQGQVQSRRVITATLSADHRVSDGHRGALFLAAVERRLQEPDKL